MSKTMKKKTTDNEMSNEECSNFGLKFLKPLDEYSDDIKALILPVDDNYVPFGPYDDIEKIVSSKLFFPTYVSGPTGTGKSMMIQQVCAKHNIPLVRINLNMMTDEDQLIGTKTLTDGNIEIIEGPVLIAMRHGIPILLDEVDAANPNTIMCIQGILEGTPYYFKLKNEVIIPRSGFNVYATANTKGKGSDDGRYIGTNVMNEAFLERFSITIEQDYPSKEQERKVIIALMNSLNCLNELFCENLLKWAESVRKSFQENAIDELITTRRLTHIIRGYKMFDDEMKAISYGINRFDPTIKEAFFRFYELSRDSVIKEEEKRKRNPFKSEVSELFRGDDLNVA